MEDVEKQIEDGFPVEFDIIGHILAVAVLVKRVLMVKVHVAGPIKVRVVRPIKETEQGDCR